MLYVDVIPRTSVQGVSSDLQEFRRSEFWPILFLLSFGYNNWLIQVLICCSAARVNLNIRRMEVGHLMKGER